MPVFGWHSSNSKQRRGVGRLVRRGECLSPLHEVLIKGQLSSWQPRATEYPGKPEMKKKQIEIFKKDGDRRRDSTDH